MTLKCLQLVMMSARSQQGQGQQQVCATGQHVRLCAAHNGQIFRLSLNDDYLSTGL